MKKVMAGKMTKYKYSFFSFSLYIYIYIYIFMIYKIYNIYI